MDLSVIKVGSSIRIKDFANILEERKEQIKVSYKEGLEHLPGFDLTPYQITIGFTEEEFQKVQKKAIAEGKKITELIRDLVLK